MTVASNVKIPQRTFILPTANAHAKRWPCRPRRSITRGITAHLPDVPLEHLQPAAGVRQGDVDALLEAAPEGLVEVPGLVGRGQHHHEAVLGASPPTRHPLLAQLALLDGLQGAAKRLFRRELGNTGKTSGALQGCEGVQAKRASMLHRCPFGCRLL